LIPARPGDILAVWLGSFTSDLIRIGEALKGSTPVASHVVVVTHQDRRGRWMGIQGAPGGVGLVDCTPFLSDSRTRSNNAQPRDDGMPLAMFLAGCAKSIGVRYDWVGIAEDACDALHVPDLAAAIDPLYRWPASHGLLPGEVVCSSLAAMLYDLPAVRWAHPDLGTERRCEPADWWDWSDRALWLTKR
jgi:hypothetical protein